MGFDTSAFKRYQAFKEEIEKGNYPGITKQWAKSVYKSGKELELFHLLSSGNKKLPKSTAIFNMGPATNCPSAALGLCQAVHNGKVICYALKAERLYPSVLPYRYRQEAYWKTHDAAEFIADFVIINELKRNPYKSLRINESGDFWGQKCIDNASIIATALKHYGVTTYVYTARSDLDFSNVQDLVVNGSGFRKAGVCNEFKYIETAEDRPDGYAICPGDCCICDRCQKSDKLTAVVKH